MSRIDQMLSAARDMEVLRQTTIQTVEAAGGTVTEHMDTLIVEGCPPDTLDWVHKAWTD